MSMHIETFTDLLQIARSQPLPQRLLFVFAGAELPEHSTPQEQADFAAGRGGALAPLMCVDKDPRELASFAALASEASQFGQDWVLVFTAALSGSVGLPPSEALIDQQLQAMTAAVRRGEFEAWLAFDRDGLPVQLGRDDA